MLTYPRAALAVVSNDNSVVKPASHSGQMLCRWQNQADFVALGLSKNQRLSSNTGLAG